MLYYIGQLLVRDFSFLNILKYITFRSGAAMFTSLLFCIFFGKPAIKWLKSFQSSGQPIRSDGPESHLKKAGTPTMGGLLILSSILLSLLIWCDLSNSYVWVVLFVMISYGVLGFLDDYLKIKMNNPKGVSGKSKLLWQFVTGFIAAIAIAHIVDPEYKSTLSLPFLKNVSINLGVGYFLFTSIVITGTSNAVNVTDGLDGLAAGAVTLVTFCLAIMCYLVGNSIFANYLHIPYIANSGELTVFCACLIGACLGFLWYNAQPAEMFMGDVGSLSLGGVVGVISAIVKQELALAILGGVFVIEALSVILQVGCFKLYGKRIFKMAPIHHHYEKSGWSEMQVVIRFWIIAIIFAIIGLSTLKLR